MPRVSYRRFQLLTCYKEIIKLTRFLCPVVVVCRGLILLNFLEEPVMVERVPAGYYPKVEREKFQWEREKCDKQMKMKEEKMRLEEEK